MIAVKRILVPVDFGETSAAALSYGTDLARMFNARLHLLHVLDVCGAVREYPVSSMLPTDPSDRLAELLTASDQRELGPVCESRVGAPADEILGYVSEHCIDLIVMGTHGRDGFARALLGSVAETVVRKAPCPVLTVHSTEHHVVSAAVPVTEWLPQRASRVAVAACQY